MKFVWFIDVKKSTWGIDAYKHETVYIKFFSYLTEQEKNAVFYAMEQTVHMIIAIIDRKARHM